MLCPLHLALLIIYMLTTSNSAATIMHRSFKINKTRWWFLLKSDENVLKKLEGEWESIQLQTKWTLECCTAPLSEPEHLQNNAENSRDATSTYQCCYHSNSQQPQSAPGSASSSPGNHINTTEETNNDQITDFNSPKTLLGNPPISQHLVS